MVEVHFQRGLRLRRREFMRNLFVVDSLDKQIQNEKEFILASAGVGGFLYLCGEY